MNFLQLHILCNRDTRTEEDLALEQQFASMEIPMKGSAEQKVIQEWRPGLIQVSHIACIYPHAKPEHTLVHLYTGAVLTVLETYAIVVHCLNQAAAYEKQNGAASYSYNVTLGTPTAVKKTEN
jgi:hypothetical protein